MSVGGANEEVDHSNNARTVDALVVHIEPAPAAEPSTAEALFVVGHTFSERAAVSVGRVGSVESEPAAADQAAPVREVGAVYHAAAAPRNGDWRGSVERFDWPVETALLIIYGPTNACPNGESGGQNVDNGANIGVMQINWPSHLDKLEKVTGSRDWTLLRDPDINIAVGYEVFVSNGRTFGAWSCHP